MIPWWGSPVKPTLDESVLIAAVKQFGSLLLYLIERNHEMAAELDVLVAQIQNAISVQKAAAAVIDAKKTDTVRLTQLSTDLKTSTDELAAVVRAASSST